jgi:hypothetical protein
MCYPQHLPNLYASTACCGDSFTFYPDAADMRSVLYDLGQHGRILESSSISSGDTARRSERQIRHYGAKSCISNAYRRPCHYVTCRRNKTARMRATVHQGQDSGHKHHRMWRLNTAGYKFTGQHTESRGVRRALAM